MVSDVLQLELKAVVCSLRILGAELRFSAGAVYDFNHRAISPVLYIFIFQKKLLKSNLNNSFTN